MSDFSSDPGAQTASMSSGSGNVIVQIVGDGNTVVAGGHSRLTLTRYLSRREIRSEFDHLSPYTMSVPLVGRAAEFDSLKAFLADTRPLLVRVITGQGGSGKTRLALELSNFAAAQGWAAGFVPGREMRSFLKDGLLIQWSWSQPSLLIVDYVAQHARLLGDWLEALADRTRKGEPPLRVLLLEREASTEAGWWPMVFGSGGYGAEAKRALLDPPEPVDLAPLRDVEQRMEVLIGVLKHLRTPAQREQMERRLESNAEFLRRLESVSWGGDPLSLLMAALAMSQHTGRETLALTRTDLAMQLATDHEANRIRALAREQGLDAELVVHLAACVTLAQGMDLDSLEQLAEAEKLAIRRPSGGDPAALADLLREALPAREGEGVAAVMPDLVGEAFVLAGLAGRAPRDAVVRCHGRFGSRVTESVIRAAQDFGSARREPVDWLRAVIERMPDDWASLSALHAQIPQASLALRETALQMTNRLVAVAQSDPKVSEVQKAHSYNALGIALAQIGQREAALAASQEAITIYRVLAHEHPDTFRSDLAASLNNLANGLSNLGQRERALAVAEEAVSIYRALADERPDAFRPDLAGSLNNLAAMLSGLGQRERALAIAAEAAAIYRALADERPDLGAHRN